MSKKLKIDDRTITLYAAHRSALVDYATPILGCRSQAEDIVQDAYLRFSSAVDRKTVSGASIAHPVAYLYRTVRNLALNGIRRQTSEGRMVSGGDLLESMPSGAPSPEHEVLYRDELRVITQALSELPERSRRAFELYRLRGYTLQQVAATLGISVGLAHHLVRDAITHCAGRLDDDV